MEIIGTKTDRGISITVDWGELTDDSIKKADKVLCDHMGYVFEFMQTLLMVQRATQILDLNISEVIWPPDVEK